MHIDSLPEFPWDTLTPYVSLAKSHVDSVSDLSVGTPVDPTPDVVQTALKVAANSPGYPPTQGTSALREAALGWLLRSRGVDPAEAGVVEHAVLPALGLKELVGLLPSMLGIGKDDVVMHPRIAYPTYDVGAKLAGARTLAADATTAVGPGTVKLVWLNSPSNPTGKVLGIDHLAKVVDWARSRGAIVLSDECYAELPWEEPWLSSGVPSVLDPRVTGGDPQGVVALHSLSKRSNMAGYRAAFAMGDQKLIAQLLELRKHMGMMVPAPVQAAMVAALDDDGHVVQQRKVYCRRRKLLRSALESAGFRIDDSEAGLYLWATHEELLAEAGNGDLSADIGREVPTWHLVEWFARRGVVVAPGSFYGLHGAQHVRISLTASDGAIDRAVSRIHPG